MPHIILDADHGGEIYGEVFVNEIGKDEDLKLALAVGDILKQYNLNVSYTRTKLIAMSWSDRFKIANETDAELFISFHKYSHKDCCDKDGTQTLIFDHNGIARNTAKNINQYLTMYGFSTHGIIEMQSQTIAFCKSKIPVMLLLYRYEILEENPEVDVRFHELSWAIALGIVKTFQIPMDDNNVFDSIYMSEGAASMKKENRNKYCDCTDKMVQYNEGDWNRRVHPMQQEQIEQLEEQEQPEQLQQPEQQDRQVEAYRYRIQVGLFRSYENALQYQEQLIQDGFDPEIVTQGEFYALHVGKFNDLDEAAVWERVLRMAGYNTLLISAN
jgi:N-acetylmuramoyl-L-alanine amidase